MDSIMVTAFASYVSYRSLMVMSSRSTWPLAGTLSEKS